MASNKTGAESAYHGIIARLPCVLCRRLGFTQGSRTTVHHIREGQGAAQRASHWLVVALCDDHHQGNLGIHGLGARGFERMYRLNELDLLADTVELVFKLEAWDGRRP